MHVDGMAWLLSFPFYIIVDTNDAPTVTEANLDGARVRFYPPFRSGPADFTSGPSIDPAAIPFVGSRPLIEPGFKVKNMAVYPILDPTAATQSACMAWGPKWENPPRTFPMDSLRIDTFASPETQEPNETLIALKLLQHLRIRSSQWWITHSSDALQSYGRNFFKASDDGRTLGGINPITNFRTVQGFEVAITNSIWKESINDTASSNFPSTADTSLLDSYWYFAKEDFRRLVIEAASACEIEKDIAIERAWKKARAEPYRRGKALNGYDLPVHISQSLKELSGRSYAEEFRDKFGNIEDLWDARGNVAHGKPASFRRDGKTRNIDAETASAFLGAAQHCVRWLRTI
jgi:hypothetical protein